jgi:antitoxin component of RelBE/YafQ-DinJ toxin-antitoxin module
MNNLTLDSLVDLYDAKCVEHEKLPIETNANREKADIFYRDHVVRLSKEIARLRAELEQQQSQQPQKGIPPVKNKTTIPGTGEAY